jgi:septal ring factor EnvC (AmiA/AmiB activator)
MARGRKPRTELTLEQQLEEVVQKISDTEGTLKSLKDQKKQLEKEIKDKALTEIDEMIKASGKSMDEVKKLLAKK